ncbi:hypothetical protein PEX1_020970 [Penicillium expansum]|uniref:Uncharacterized protein n=1 Tax=Penicillium expansum TaxID=27334 RepID=A0A0A2ILQ5_PENEN|nr:hypothetical protein PEX2_000710 [Penicillium expansum]KAJ5517831.1 hypothetical protein N7453_000253 [Penicillium expansum]KGO43378.1 hypothetical protein PEXP_096690 [Penicillium expansum]KGO57396.1 hypothetical protein PEX2_000710 [Penicillium expansum]KGO64222.1 hypothetical protein PEX1_020970 [Penicillium expansum]
MGNEDINRKDVSTQKDWPDDENNPFVAFRRYADEQVSTMLQSITGLPSMVTQPHNGHWDIFADNHGYQNRMARQRTGDNTENSSYPTDRESASGYPGNRDGDDPRNYAKNSLSPSPESDDSWRKWCNGPSDFFGLDSFFDRFFEDRFFPFASQLLHSGHNLLLRDMFEDTDSPTWPIGYILFSPYSPLHLERQAQYQAHRDKGVFSSLMSSLHLNSDRDPSEPQWREAFEDLLRLENDKPMLDGNAPATRSESGKDWLQGLVKRGSLGDKWKYVPRTNGQPWSGITLSSRAGPEQDQSQSRSLPEKEKESADTKEADSELDLYERFLHDIENREREFFRGVSESPLLRLLLEERRQQQEELEKYRRSPPTPDDQHSHDDNENWIDLVSGGNKKSVPETPRDLPAEIDSKPTEAVSEPVQSRVISTMTRTERVRLPDGSVESKIVNTRRFADGREESNESVEVSHPQESSKLESDSSKNGWFWRD